MQGPSRALWLRLAVATIFAAAFVSGAVLVFGISSIVGARVIGAMFTETWRLGAAAGALFALAAFDLIALRRGSYCSLGWRRQTPQRLIYFHTVPTVAAVWGFDAGLAFTTFRVAATTWGALTLALLGLASWWTGVVYGLAFALPLSALFFLSPPRVERMLAERRHVQFASALLLAACGVAILV